MIPSAGCSSSQARSASEGRSLRAAEGKQREKRARAQRGQDLGRTTDKESKGDDPAGVLGGAGESHPVPRSSLAEETTTRHRVPCSFDAGGHVGMRVQLQVMIARASRELPVRRELGLAKNGALDRSSCCGKTQPRTRVCSAAHSLLGSARRTVASAWIKRSARIRARYLARSGGTDANKAGADASERDRRHPRARHATGRLGHAALAARRSVSPARQRAVTSHGG